MMLTGKTKNKTLPLIDTDNTDRKNQEQNLTADEHG